MCAVAIATVKLNSSSDERDYSIWIVVQLIISSVICWNTLHSEHLTNWCCSDPILSEQWIMHFSQV